MAVTANTENDGKLSTDDMKFVAGSLCLDFVNTVDAWVSAPGRKPGASHSEDYSDTPIREKIVDYDALVRWGRLADAISSTEAAGLARYAAKNPSDAVAVLNRALRLRLALYRLFKSLLLRWAPEVGDLEVLHRELAIARKHEQLIHRKGGFHWAWDGSRELPDRILWPVARSAADLLTSSSLTRLRQCKGNECGWLFLDSSRNRSRHWCDMSDCGNLSKVRRFRERR